MIIIMSEFENLIDFIGLKSGLLQMVSETGNAILMLTFWQVIKKKLKVVIFTS